MTEALIDVRDLHVSYGSVVAVRGIAFHVDEGELVSLVGANGAGKTSTLAVLSGLLRPRSGTVTFDGRAVTGRRSSELVRMGLVLVPEGRQVLAQMSVRENLELGGFQRRDRVELRREIDEMMQRFPILGNRAAMPAGALSGGEQQLLAIARGLLARPRLLLLDEPSMGLAPQAVEQVFSILEDLHHRGRTILLVEQNAFRALQLSDRAYVMETGSVVMEGPGPTLMRDPRIVDAYLGGAVGPSGRRSSD
jgi:branched-chain amino acid transport system ATP-binding protein